MTGLLPARADSGLIRPARVAALAGIALLVGGSPASSAASPSVAVDLADFTIRLSRGTVPAGTVSFRVLNRGHLPHAFRVGGAGTRALAHGERQTITVRLARAGTYRFSSTVPGDAALGMQGALRAVRRPGPARPLTTNPRLTATPVATGLGALTHVTAPPGDERRLLAVQRDGLVVLLKDGVRAERPFVDLRPFVSGEGEKGLLSLAFAPDYASTGLFYAFFNNRDGNIRIAEYRRSHDDPDVAERSWRRVLALPKEAADHNGGMMQFGPDGYLYVSIGDGGAAPPGASVGARAQALDDLFGTIIRIDPRGPAPYAVPPDNPFAEVADVRSEIVAYGLRNPWRFWIDVPTRTMWIGDVGQSSREEVDRLPLGRLGLNFGWPCREGTTVPEGIDAPARCMTDELTPPLHEYSHTGGRCSITGGVVVRDPALVALRGVFLYTDFCQGRISGLTARGLVVPLPLSVRLPTSFGVDARGRVHVATLTGEIFRLEVAAG